MQNTKSTNEVGKRNDAAIEIILDAPAVAENGRHEDICYRTDQLRANGRRRDEAIAAVARIYLRGTGDKRKITLAEIQDAYDGAEKLGHRPWSTSRRELGHYRRESTGNKVVYTHDG